MASAKLATVGILSIGDMGMGLAKLLVAKGFSVATNCTGRSKDTIERVKAAQVTDLSTDTDLVKTCDIILSVVPPRDAEATAQRIIDAMALVTKAHPPLYFADMNAVAPSTIKQIAQNIDAAQVPITLIDGSILGGPPHPTSGASSSGSAATTAVGDWNVPSLPTSGPLQVADIPGFGAALSTALNMRHISPAIGASSGLKMCFASLSKGYSAIAVQSFTTAQRLGVLPALQEALQELVPQRVKQTEGALVNMPPKAYRWVREMKEKVGQRKRGRTVEDVAVAMAEGLEKKRKKTE
ncbi:6-phosphogluconate dehydrogenase C-terminal domain-like protein [Cryphonectria parasitica EP155]|uniref:6-phosphogluconate dehydrogenase C-terminal domain-like protein n=1 Tax=Cryphonectria parasitica (strain ATCC 38755 / EP155) TaxID=660469 RepID=A0A9P4XWX1_CRYP1|nr:6-phosphogluconate dehydrogenase C-terminal domain-like protein [Cryphonectria parasitica EP155]KAF3762434.1 6-phosphogluconate dehydrogenase C-terminal domain-like protein [Cryphonectria parasitica EP155]